MLVGAKGINKLSDLKGKVVGVTEFATVVLLLEEEEKPFGKNPWAHGLDPNRKALEKFIGYAEDQGYISSRPALDEIFAPLVD